MSVAWEWNQSGDYIFLIKNTYHHKTNNTLSNNKKVLKTSYLKPRKIQMQSLTDYKWIQ